MNIGKLKRSTQIAIMTGAGSGAVEKTAIGTSPLTLSDSVAGNIHSITVKGHSEVVDGAIKSVGDAGWGVVDLGTLTWTYNSEIQAFNSEISNIKINSNNDIIALCAVYNSVVSYTELIATNKTTWINNTQHKIVIRDTSYTDATTFKSAMNGVLLYYPLADTTGATPIFGITSKDGAGQGTAATITTGLPLRSVSDSIYDTADNDKATKKCAEVDLSTLSWSALTRDDKQFFYSNSIRPNYKSGTDFICADYLYVGQKTDSEMFTGDDNVIARAGDGQIKIRDDRYSTTDAFIASLTGKNLVYALATPTETPLTSAETTALSALETYDPTTVISITDNPSITVKYMGKRAARTAPKKRTNRKKKS